MRTYASSVFSFPCIPYSCSHALASDAAADYETACAKYAAEHGVLGGPADTERPRDEALLAVFVDDRCSFVAPGNARVGMLACVTYPELLGHSASALAGPPPTALRTVAQPRRVATAPPPGQPPPRRRLLIDFLDQIDDASSETVRCNRS